MISAILLAAGQSRRMGDFKQLLDFDGRTFVECCADRLLAAGLGEIIVVTGYRAAEVAAALGGRPVRLAHNPDYELGMSTSVQCGMRAVSPAARAVLVALADQPQIPSSVIRRIVEVYEARRPLIVVPRHAGRNGHPILLDARLRPEVLALDREASLRQVVAAHEAETLRLEVEGDVLTDFDYPEDYRRFKERR